MKLCICEKPSVAKTIAGVFGNYSRKDGYFQAGEYNITWAFGHLFELAYPGEYKDEWEQWSLSSLPMFPDQFKTSIKNDSGVKKQFKVIKKLLKQADLIINCGDAGQEGELIMRWIFENSSYDAPIKRLWISSLTHAAIQKGFKDLKPGTDFDRLYQAGKARAVSDWLIGLNATRAFTVAYVNGKGVLSIGRVQTPTLNMIVQRDLEIDHFKPEPYWTLTTEFKGAGFTHAEKKFETKEKAQAILQKITGQPFQITSVQETEKTKSAPLPFDLTSAQSVGNKLFGFSSDKTLSLIQDLYEWQILSYPRVDNRYLPEDQFPEMEGIIKGISKDISGLDPQKIAVKKTRMFNDSKVTDHHAIIPTFNSISHAGDKASEDHKKIYDLIARQFLAQFYPDCRYAETKVKGESAGEPFKLKGTVIKDAGWQAIAKAGKMKKDKSIPNFSQGEQGDHRPVMEEKETTPPKRFTEATLLKAMENAGRFVDEDELAEAIRENGIGRPSTRAAIIEGLLNRNYIERKGKSLYSTITGKKLINVIKNDVITKPELTAKWEQALRKVESGEYDYDKFLTNAKKLTSMLVSEAKAGQGNGAIIEDNSLTDIKCQCGSFIKETKKTFQCTGDGCNFAVYRIVCGKKVSKTVLKEVLATGQTRKKRSFKSKAGKKFKAHLRLKDPEEGKDLRFFEFPPKG